MFPAGLFGQTREIDSLQQIVNTGDDTSKIDALIWLGFRVDGLQERYDYRTEALKKAEEIGDKRRQIKAHSYVGYLDEVMGNYESAIQHYQDMGELAEQVDDPALLSRSYQFRGDVLNDLGEHETALRWYRKMLQIGVERDSSLLDNACNSIGTCFKELDILDSSLYYHNKALMLRLKQGDDLGVSYSYNNIGLVYKKKEEYDMAIEFLQKSLAEKTRLGNVKGMASSNINIGNVLNLQGKHKEALKYLRKGIIYADSAKADRFLINGYQGAITAYLENIDPQIADYFEALNELRDSLDNEAAIAQARDIEAKYHIEEKERMFIIQKEKDELEKKALDERNRSLTAQVYYAVSGLVILIALILLIVRSSRQRRKSNELLASQKAVIEQKNQDITDSINYAKNIQEGMLPGEAELADALGEHFVLYKPKDIVSGDFYWVSKRKSHSILAVVDCTGHGVPGGFMSMLGHNVLNQVINDNDTTTPAQALELINEKVLGTYSKSQERTQVDGMDVALCAINRDTLELEFAGALRPLWILRDDECISLKGTKRAIGTADGPPFEIQNFQLQHGDMIYAFSDGFPDQFGGERGKKLKTSGFREMLLSVHKQPLAMQRKMLDTRLEEWMRDYEQLDDICVVGLKV